MTGFGTNHVNNITTPNAPATSARQPYIGNSAVPQSTPASQPSTPTVSGQAAPTKNPAPNNQPSSAQLQQEAMNILQSGGGLQNPLNSYFQVQPIFKLFMTQDVDPFSASSQVATNNPKANIPAVYQTLQNMKNVVLAQSGVTSYNIASVEMDAVLGGPSGAGLMTMPHNVQITIKEAAGVGFPEAMLAAAKFLGVKNHLKSFVYLQLQFIAYDEMGNIVPDPVGPELNIPNMWIWQLTITDIDVKLDAGGGTYVLTCIPQTERIYNDIFFSIPETKTISGGTLGAITTNLATVLNKSWEDRYANTTTIFDFKWHNLSDTLNGNFASSDDPSAYSTNFSKPDFNTVEGLEYNGTNSTFLFHNSATIETFLNAVISNTPQCQLLGNNGPADRVTPPPGGFEKSIRWMIESDVEYLGQFETYTQEYYKKVTFHIRPYYTHEPVFRRDQQKNSLVNGVSFNAIQDHVKQNLISKRYEYLYTGLNIDVIDFDVHYNYQWYAIMNRHWGILNDVDQIAPQPRVASSTQTNPDGPAADEYIASTPDNQINIPPLEQNYQNALDAQSAANQKLISLQQNSDSSASDIANAQKDLTTQNSNVLSARSAFSAAQLRSQQSVQVQSNGGSITYAESLISTPQNTASNNQNSNSSPSSGLNVSFAQLDKSATDPAGDGARQATGIDKSVYSAVTGQMTAPLSYKFQSINLSIRGDPYWIGQTDLVRIDYMRNQKRPPANTPDAWVGDNCFVLHFRYPLAIGDDYTPVFKDSLVFSGLYKVTNIKSIFGGNDGFKQELTASRLILIDIIEALKGPSSSSSTQTPPVTDQNNNPAPGSPPTASATPPPSNSGTSVDWYNNAKAAPYMDTINQAADKYGVPAPLLAWQLGQESSFNPNAVGAGSTSSGVPTGIAQFTTGTAENVPGYGPLDPTDPNASIMAAAAYDQYLYNKNGSWQGAFQQYGTLSGNPAQSTWNGFNNALTQSGLKSGS